MTGGAQATWIASSQHCEIKDMMPCDTSWSGFQYLNLGNMFLCHVPLDAIIVNLFFKCHRWLS